MAAPAKRKPAAGRPAAGRPAAGRRAPPPSAPFLRFHHSEALRERTLAVLEKVERARDPAAHRRELAGIVVELTNCGLDAYFMKPLKLAKAGVVLQQTAKLGMAGSQQVLGTVIRQIIGRMEAPQLLSVCGSIRQFMK